ncbi:MAG: TIR domain-containing protein [Clostridiales bacterium]|nr:TIR domain-containing protein [Clostridiales bacterium]
MERVYISYANEDLSVAKKVNDILSENGINTYIVDHTEENLNGDVALEMLDGIKNSNVFLCLYSKYSNSSNFISIEINAAVKREKRVYIINIDGTSLEQKTNFAIANSTLIKGDFDSAINKFITIIKGGE